MGETIKKAGGLLVLAFIAWGLWTVFTTPNAAADAVWGFLTILAEFIGGLFEAIVQFFERLMERLSQNAR